MRRPYDTGSALRQYDKNDKTGQTIVSHSICKTEGYIEKVQWNQIFLGRDLLSTDILLP
jgi:hypothetical protein